MKKNLAVHITDKNTNTDLKIYDNRNSFTFDFEYNIYGVKATRSITLDEDMASLLFMGMNEIFDIKETHTKKEDTSVDILEDFFNRLKQFDNKFSK